MYLEFKEHGEEEHGEVKVAPKTAEQKIADAIRKGHSQIGECHDHFTCSHCQPGVHLSGCAISAAFAGLGFDPRMATVGGLAIITGCDDNLATEINAIHYNGTPRLQIADMLEQGTFPFWSIKR